MARLFSVNFQFQNKEHVALVAIREQGCDMHCQIRFIDHKLNTLLAGQPFVFSLLEGMKQPVNVTDSAVQSLLNCTIDAMSRQLAQRA